MKKSVKIFLRVLMFIAAVLLVIFYIGPVITVGEMVLRLPHCLSFIQFSLTK